MSAPRPFKNPAYTKNASRRTKNLKAVLGQERERERLEREKRRAEREEAMEVDGAAAVGALMEDDIPSCTWPEAALSSPGPCPLSDRCRLDLSIEAPPSVLPQRRYCDITGLEVRESSALQHNFSMMEFCTGTIHGSNYGATLSRQEHL